MGDWQVKLGKSGQQIAVIHQSAAVNSTTKTAVLCSVWSAQASGGLSAMAEFLVKTATPLNTRRAESPVGKGSSDFLASPTTELQFCPPRERNFSHSRDLSRRAGCFSFQSCSGHSENLDRSFPGAR